MPDEDVKIYVPQASAQLRRPENESDEVKLYPPVSALHSPSDN